MAPRVMAPDGGAGVRKAIELPRKVYARTYSSGRTVIKTRDFGPPAAPLLMIRAARRAVAEDPNDPRVYLLLAEAYTTVLGQEEHWANYKGDSRRLGRRFFFDLWFGFYFDARRLRFNNMDRFRRSSFLHGCGCFDLRHFDNFFYRCGLCLGGWCVHAQFPAQLVG